MHKKVLIILFSIAILVSGAAALLQTVPGYMDAEYYYVGSQRIAEGSGGLEPFIWNYLNNPDGLPFPAFIYWMPLPSLIGSIGLILFQSDTFLASKFLFVILSGLISPLTYWFTFRLFKDQKASLIAGFLAIFSGFYLIFTTNTESVVLYIFLGGLYFLLVANWLDQLGTEKLGWLSFLIGLTAGLLHLCRAEGAIWICLFLMIMLFAFIERPLFSKNKISLILASGGLALLGYFLVMAPWYARNFSLFGHFMAPGGSLTLWMSNYDQTFIYPASELNFQNWLSIGLSQIVLDRLLALWENLKTTLAVQSQVFLLPFILLSIKRRWTFKPTKIFIFAWFLLLGIMSFAFPYSGPRGGFLHAGAALQIFFWGYGALGIVDFIGWGVKKREWKFNQSYKVFSFGFIAIAALMTIALFWQRVIGPDMAQPVWASSYRSHLEIHEVLYDIGANDDDIVMINNPPGFYFASERPSVVIPAADVDTLIEVAKKYDVRWVVIDENVVDALQDLVVYPTDRNGLNYILTKNDIHYYYYQAE
jgi:hypothetical protein